MKILITALGEYTGDKLQVGKTYNVQLADNPTEKQNRAFHALLQCYWASGCHSYNASSFLEFRQLIKLYLGAGVEKYYRLVDEDGKRCKRKIDTRIKSWSNYTRKERTLAINNLIAEMTQAGADNDRFREIVKGME